MPCKLSLKHIKCAKWRDVVGFQNLQNGTFWDKRYHSVRNHYSLSACLYIVKLGILMYLLKEFMKSSKMLLEYQIFGKKVILVWIYTLERHCNRARVVNSFQNSSQWSAFCTPQFLVEQTVHGMDLVTCFMKSQYRNISQVTWRFSYKPMSSVLLFSGLSQFAAMSWPMERPIWQGTESLSPTTHEELCQ